MADTPETKAKKAIRKLIAAVAADLGYGVKLRSNAAGGVGFTTGIPDFTLYWRPVPHLSAITIDIEVKAQNNTATPTQEVQLKQAHAVGVHSLVIWGDNAKELEYLDKLIRTVKHDSPAVLKLSRLV